MFGSPLCFFVQIVKSLVILHINNSLKTELLLHLKIPFQVSRVSSPVLVIHGTEDEVIDFSHGLAIYEKCPRAVEPLWVEGAGHNDVELYNQVISRF